MGATNARQANLRNLTEVVSGRSEHIGVTVMTHGARLILISVKADDFKEKLQVDFVFMSARHSGGRRAMNLLERCRKRSRTRPLYPNSCPTNRGWIPRSLWAFLEHASHRGAFASSGGEGGPPPRELAVRRVTRAADSWSFGTIPVDNRKKTGVKSFR